MIPPEIIKQIWGDGVELQVDSYATGHPQVHAYIDREKMEIKVQLTDGGDCWVGHIPLPKDFSRNYL